MRLLSSVQGMLSAPALVCLFFVLKAFCPDSAGGSCFADQFAVPIFMPVVAVYRLFGDSSIIGGQDLLLVLVYWAFIGFLIGYLVDLLFAHLHHEAVRPMPADPVSAPAPVMKPAAPTPLSPQEPKIASILQAKPLAPDNLPGAMVMPAVKSESAAPVKKLPINLLEREEYK